MTKYSCYKICIQNKKAIVEQKDKTEKIVDGNNKYSFLYLLGPSHSEHHMYQNDGQKKRSICYASERSSTEISVQEHKPVTMKDELKSLELHLIPSL